MYLSYSRPSELQTRIPIAATEGLYLHVPIDGDQQGALQITGDDPAFLRVFAPNEWGTPHLKTVPRRPDHTFPRPLIHLHSPSRWRTLYTLLDSDGGPIYTTNACHLIAVPRPSLSVEPYHDPVPESCSTYQRLNSSPQLPSSPRLSSPRTTARSSLRQISLVRIIAVRYAFCRSSLILVSQTRTSNARYILTRPLP